MIAHSSWNASAFFGGGETFVMTYVFAMVPAFLLLVVFAIWARNREGRMLTRSLSDCADRGLLSPAEVPWLVRLSARRASRRFARGYGGRVAERSMREYQQQAIELAFLHDRYLRGTAPADFAERGSAMVQRLHALRPYVQFPAPALRQPAGLDRTGKVDGEHPEPDRHADGEHDRDGGRAGPASRGPGRGRPAARRARRRAAPRHPPGDGRPAPGLRPAPADPDRRPAAHRRGARPAPASRRW